MWSVVFRTMLDVGHIRNEPALTLIISGTPLIISFAENSVLLLPIELVDQVSFELVT